MLVLLTLLLNYSGPTPSQVFLSHHSGTALVIDITEDGLQIEKSMKVLKVRDEDWVQLTVRDNSGKQIYSETFYFTESITIEHTATILYKDIYLPIAIGN